MSPTHDEDPAHASDAIAALSDLRSKPEDPKIFWFNSERADIVEEVVRRMMDRYDADDSAELVLNDAAYHEIRRLEASTSAGAKHKLEYWRGILRRVGSHEHRGASTRPSGSWPRPWPPTSRGTSTLGCTALPTAFCPGCSPQR